jgi:hypothetical protein
MLLSKYSKPAKRKDLKLRKKIRSVGLVTTLILTGIQCSGETLQEKEAKTLVLFKDFKEELQSELIQAVEEKGPANSIEVCAKISPQMEERISQEKGLLLKRISDKNRNPNHSPDIWESEVIQTWKKEMAEGKVPQVYSAKTESGYRIMKPIILDNPTCLKCHGGVTDIDPETRKRIDSAYPKDKAKDYKLGELRGAMSASWRI